MRHTYIRKYPTIEDLRKKAKKRIPKFVFEYLDGGCNEEINLYKNTSDIRKIELIANYINSHKASDMRTELFGHVYDAPFGVSPVGLQGLIWPGSAEILARASFSHNIPFILSTTSTSSIEKISEITEGKAWFQLYHPAKDALRDKIIKRAEEAQCPVLVILSDVPGFGYRPREIRTGMAAPPKMNLQNVLQILSRPGWALQTLIHGTPTFQTLKPYMPNENNVLSLAAFMDETFSNRLSEERIATIRDIWKRKLVIKGISNENDTEKAIRLGVDGIIVSNHGGRQLDAGQSSIHSLKNIVEKYKGKIKIMLDSGLRSGPDIARALASGAEFTFLGRGFMYGTAALGAKGGDHTISILKSQLQQLMEQISCSTVENFPEYLMKE